MADRLRTATPAAASLRTPMGPGPVQDPPVRASFPSALWSFSNQDLQRLLLSYENPKVRGHQEVSEFRKPSAGSAWPTLQRSQVADEMDERIDDPDMISQSVLNVCGPAAIIHMLLLRNPARYVDLVSQLFATGEADAEGADLSADADLRKNSPPQGMAQVDWMLLSSIRDSENAIFDFEGRSSEDFSGITTPGELTAWMKSILKCRHVSWNSTYLFGEIDTIKKAGRAAERLDSVALLIDSDMLDGKQVKKVGYPDHWVILKSGVKITDAGTDKAQLQFSVWTWGEATYRSLTLDRETFISTFYGAAIGS